MTKRLKHILLLIIASTLTACEASLDIGDIDIPPPGDGDDNRPTTPIKRRPIVPKNKLPRPRVIDDVNLKLDILSISTTAENGDVAEVELRSCDGNISSYTTTVDGIAEFEINDFNTEYILTIYYGEDIYQEVISFE